MKLFENCCNSQKTVIFDLVEARTEPVSGATR